MKAENTPLMILWKQQSLQAPYPPQIPMTSGSTELVQAVEDAKATKVATDMLESILNFKLGDDDDAN